jgi:hypothetical protein
MSEEIRDIKDSISFLAETQSILSESMLLQQQQFNEFQQVLNASREDSERRINDFLDEGRRNRQESERRFEASQARLEAILLNQQRQIKLSEERIVKVEEQHAEADQRFNILLQELRHTSQRIDRIEQS